MAVALHAGVPPSTKGRFLVATPPLADPNFDRSVVFMIEHHRDGALGVVVNRPSDERLDAPLERWAELLTAPSVVFSGGPVDTDALIALARVERAPDASLGDQLTQLSNEVYSVDLGEDPALISGLLDELRVFRGYAGWGPLQLETEIDQGGWLVLDVGPDDLFHPDPLGLWRAVLGRQQGRLAWLANAPDDLSAN